MDGLFAGRYEIGPLLGQGGWAQVYAATDTTRGTEVALKIGRSEASERIPTFLARFQREVELAGQVRHPHVIEILDHGVADNGAPWLTMPALRGRDLAQELRTGGALAPQRAAALLLPCLDALGEAHRAGIVHRDLKPGNLFLADEGDRLVLLDFGGAFQPEAAPDTRLSTTGVMVGTPRYLAPEYIRTRLATPRSDVYQLGLVLSEMLSGEPVIDSDDLFTCLQAHCNGHVEHPARVLSGPFGPLIARATATDAADRFEDAAAMAAALARAASASPLQLGAPARPPFRFATAAAALAVFAVAVAVAAAAYHASTDGAAGSAVQAVERPPTIMPEDRRAASATAGDDPQLPQASPKTPLPPVEASAGARPVEASTGARPVEATPGARPVEATPGSRPVEATPGARPVETSTDARPVEATPGAPLAGPAQATPDHPAAATPRDSSALSPRTKQPRGKSASKGRTPHVPDAAPATPISLPLIEDSKDSDNVGLPLPEDR
jgi:eukaryotic-like serine/threonine-protein kinase